MFNNREWSRSRYWHIFFLQSRHERTSFDPLMMDAHFLPESLLRWLESCAEHQGTGAKWLLPQAIRKYPTDPAYLQSLGGQKVAISTVYRWLLAGVGGRRLEAIKVGGRTYTSKAALQRFTVRLVSEGVAS